MVDKNKAKELRWQGFTYESIGEVFGVSRQRIHQLLTGYKPKNWREGERAYRRRFYQTPKGKKKRRQEMAKYRHRAKILVLTHYGNGKCACAKCGFSDIRALSIDHIIATGKKGKFRKGDGIYNWLIKNKYPQGYQTLCMNCQWIKRYDNNECHRLDTKNILTSVSARA